jgi:hypothetical protein
LDTYHVTAPSGRRLRPTKLKRKRKHTPKHASPKSSTNHDDLSDMGSDTTTVSARTAKVPKINVSNMRPTDLVKVLEGWSDKDKNELLDQILLKGEDF